MSTTTVAREAAATTNGKKKKSKPVWRCQYCAQGHHRSCPRATRYNGELWLCQCNAGADQHHGHYCLACKHTEPGDLQDWSCIDVNACIARRQQRNDRNPIWRMIQAARVHGALERKAKQLGQEALLAGINPYDEEAIERMAEITDTLNHLVRDASPKKPRKASTPKPSVGKCECCGDPTKGGRFLPGHDARLGSRLVQQVAEGSLAAYNELAERNWLKKIPKSLMDRITEDASGRCELVLK